MDQESTVILKGILAKEPHELTPYDIAFLKARISYVGKNSRAKFAAILAADTPAEEKKEEAPSQLEGTSIHPADETVAPVAPNDAGQPEQTPAEPQKPAKGKKNKTVPAQSQAPIHEDAIDIEGDDDGDTETIDGDDEVVE